MLISSAQHAKYFSGNLQLKCRGEVRSPDRQSTVRTANQQPTTNSWFLVRHRRPTAHARARYRCFLPDLAGLAGRRRAGPMPDGSILTSGFGTNVARPPANSPDKSGRSASSPASVVSTAFPVRFYIIHLSNTLPFCLYILGQS